MATVSLCLRRHRGSITRTVLLLLVSTVAKACTSGWLTRRGAAAVFAGFLFVAAWVAPFASRMVVTFTMGVLCILVIILESAAAGLWADNLPKGALANSLFLGVLDPANGAISVTAPLGTDVSFGYAFGFAWAGVAFAIITAPIAVVAHKARQHASK
jgi:hypothetical protein